MNLWSEGCWFESQGQQSYFTTGPQSGKPTIKKTPPKWPTQLTFPPDSGDGGQEWRPLGRHPKRQTCVYRRKSQIHPPPPTRRTQLQVLTTRMFTFGGLSLGESLLPEPGGFSCAPQIRQRPLGSSVGEVNACSMASCWQGGGGRHQVHSPVGIGLCCPPWWKGASHLPVSRTTIYHAGVTTEPHKTGIREDKTSFYCVSFSTWPYFAEFSACGLMSPRR